MKRLLQSLKDHIDTAKKVDESRKTINRLSSAVKQLENENYFLQEKLKSLQHFDNTFRLFGLPVTKRVQWSDDDKNALRSSLTSTSGKRFLLELFQIVDAAQKNAVIHGGDNTRYAFGSLFLFTYILQLAGLILTEIHWEQDGDSVTLEPKFSVNSQEPSDSGSLEDSGALFGRFRNDIWKQT